MRRIVSAVVALGFVVAVVILPAPAQAWGPGVHHFPHHFPHGHFRHGHFFGGFGAGVFTGVFLGSAFAPVYAYPPPVYAYPAPVYAAPAPVYWYFCRSAGAYYPYVASCPEAWVPVPAQ
jgi:hypothetical protein